MTVTNTTNNNSTNADLSSEVADTFVETYYGTLTQKPTKLSLLYKQDSQVTHTNFDNESSHFSGKQIEGALQELTNGHAKNVKLKFYLVESQMTKDSVLVTVHGAFIKTNSSEVINFNQVFILAPQKNGYYVLNDILKLDAKSFASQSNYRDVEVDSTAATMGEGSVHSFSEEEIRSIEAASSDEKDTTDLKEEPTTTATATTTTSTPTKKNKSSEKKSTNNGDDIDTSSKKKRQNKKSSDEKKVSQQQQPVAVAVANKQEVKKPAASSDAPTSYAAIVGGDEYVSVIQSTQQQQQVKEKKKRTTGPKPDKKKFERKEPSAENNNNIKSEEKVVTEKKQKKKFERKPSPAAEDNKKEVTADEDGFEQKKPKKYVKRGAEKFNSKRQFNNNNNSNNNGINNNNSSNADENNKEAKPKRIFNDDNKFGIYVARVEPTTTSQQLHDVFSKYGEIVDMNNRSKANEKKPKFKLGYALVFYNNQESVNKAIAEKEISVNGQQVDVTVHSRKNKTTRSE